MFVNVNVNVNIRNLTLTTLPVLDEEFQDYQKILDDMATDPTPVTLPDLPSLGATPNAS